VTGSDAKQQRVTDLSGSAGDGDLHGSGHAVDLLVFEASKRRAKCLMDAAKSATSSRPPTVRDPYRGYRISR
jgi:hypothetical protein